MFEGKTDAAFNLLSEGGRGTPLHLDQPADSTSNWGVTVREQHIREVEFAHPGICYVITVLLHVCTCTCILP